MLIEFSKHLGTIINMDYPTIRTTPIIHQFETLEREILNYQLPDQYELGLTNLARFHSFHVQLHYQWVQVAFRCFKTIFLLTVLNRALLIALYCSYGSETQIGLDAARQGTWQRRMRLKAGDAASQTNDILDRLAEENLLRFAGPMSLSRLLSVNPFLAEVIFISNYKHLTLACPNSLRLHHLTKLLGLHFWY